jgi:hypothetical protein
LGELREEVATLLEFRLQAIHVHPEGREFLAVFLHQKA